jgi:hypothetical protein
MGLLISEIHIVGVHVEISMNVEELDAPLGELLEERQIQRPKSALRQEDAERALL